MEFGRNKRFSVMEKLTKLAQAAILQQAKPKLTRPHSVWTLGTAIQ
jgi:hypothetical protein